jgi:hypothetical protein
VNAATLCLLLAGLASLPAETPEQALAAGVDDVQQGRYAAGLLKLDSAARAWEGRPEHAAERARACLYLGVAYLAMDQPSLANRRFREALQADEALTLSPDEFSRRVRRTFEAVRAELVAEKTARAVARKSLLKRPLAVVALGGAAAAGIALAIAPHERDNRPPVARIDDVRPAGTPIVDLTRVTLAASAQDPDGEPLRFQWAFGDGETAEGPQVTHVFRQAGVLTVTVTVRDGLTSTSASTAVTVRDLNGAWDASPPVLRVQQFVLSQRAGGLTAMVQLDDGSQGFSVSGQSSLRDPRGVGFGFRAYSAPNTCLMTFAGETDAAVGTLSGRLSCASDGCFCLGADLPIVLVRR